MTRTVHALFLAALLGAAGVFSADAQEAKRFDKPDIKGGIEGKVKKVDLDKQTLTITANGRDRTFTITDDTTMVGPRGGLVRRRLRDPRFHEGLDIIVVPDGSTAKELHLGYDRRAAQEKENEPKPSTKGTAATKDRSKDKSADTAKKKDSKTVDKTTPKSATGAKDQDEDDDDEEFPGKVKSVEPSKRVLVITLLNGKDRSYLLSKDVKILVKGTPSKQGLQDPMLKPGVPVTVITEPGGRKVKEVKVAPASATKGKKAG
jgi:predicted RNA-binding protein